jgi:crossover junction endodeoxyribonuclease RuvC
MLDNDSVLSKLVHFKEYKGFKRLTCIEQSIGNLLDEWKPNIVVIEGYALGSTNNLALMVEVGTMVRRQLHMHGITPWWVCPPTQLKKWTTGKGNAKKPDMAASVLDRWGFTSASDDIVDAFALAKLGQALEADPNLSKSLKGVACEH